jgi:hypothetical protein
MIVIQASWGIWVAASRRPVSLGNFGAAELSFALQIGQLILVRSLLTDVINAIQNDFQK